MKLVARLGQARIVLRVDLGFGDPILPAPVEAQYPSLLDMPAPRLLVYPQETAIAEKLHALISRGLDNSRVKDYYDLWVLSQEFAFDATPLCAALASTCAYRGTTVVAGPEGLTTPYAASHQSQWARYLQRNMLKAPDLSEAVRHISDFVGPVVAALAEGRPFAGLWPAGGPWTRP
ncbi:MAG: nucleotidyl transferase AbiEii/AbiGii toxin family protein [Armatimonadetes bacterium]|nr:nucleotidyl transferase AbiEii/AbiGii toxin family protein [Armatimonadota bacterium]